MKFSVGNLGGTLYKGDIQVCDFKFVKGQLVSLVQHTDDMAIVPFDCSKDGINTDTLTRFFYYRITPSTRINIDETLAATPIVYYQPERIIRYSAGRCIHDRYWVECDADDTCWK